MFQKFKDFRIILIYLVLFLTCIYSLNSSRKLERDLNWSHRLALFVTTPVQTVITTTLRGVNSLLQDYFFLIQTREENKFLLEQNRKLQGQLAGFVEIQIENQRLRNILEFEKEISYKKIISQVIARDSNPDFRTIRINKGTSDGIVRGMPVVTHEGIVGRVFRTTKSVSDVLTILDNQSAVDALIQRSRTRGIVEGISENFCQMKYTLRTNEVEIGDQIISSGLGGVFPKGLNLGIVSRVEKKSYGISQTIELKPSVDFSKLEEVIVLLRPQNNVLSQVEVTQP